MRFGLSCQERETAKRSYTVSIETIVVKEREITGKEESGRIRREGLVPAVVYGLKKGSVPISVSPKQIAKVFQSEKGLNSILLLTLGDTGRTSHVMIKDMTKHPVTDRLMHVDFLRVDMDEVIESSLPLNYTGTAQGVKLGGIMQIVRHEIMVSCKPGDLPGKVDVPVDHLNIDEAVRVSDLELGDKIEILLEEDRVLAVVHEREAEVVEEEETEGIEEDATEETKEETEE
ncbi:MAG: 50S ribosomal protein L25 [Acidobacteria bacterium]|nr:MAG: 50S ribosomal protein L25 [Acidobacteriota bacterium]